MSRGERGQSMVEYLIISLPILLALLALAGPIRTMIGGVDPADNGLMNKVEHQLTRTDHRTVDAFLP